MAKRFIDTGIFKNDWVRSLDAPCKLLWLYILSDCDHAGIWNAELDVAQLRLGVKITGDPIKCFGGKVIPIGDGARWFIPGFIEYQYGRLNPDNRLHGSVINILSRENLIDENLNIKKEGPSEDLARSLQGPKDIYKEQLKETDKVKENSSRAKKLNASDLIPESWDAAEFNELWADFIKVRQAKKKVLTDTGVKQLIGKLKKMAGDEWWRARGMMTQSITHSWDGFYDLKPEDVKLYEPVVERDFWGNPVKSN